MTHPASAHRSTASRLAITVRGVVQGVGFRPFVYNAASACRLSGWVQNTAELVHIEVQGSQPDLDAFCEKLRRHPPRQAHIDALEISQIPCQDNDTSSFEIRSSTGHAAPRPTIPADLATCDECLQEIRTPAQRRFRYPFTNCTNCGPRWSIIERIPYDRPRTSMRRFQMCPACTAEYQDPADRRFHAQPIACPDCGPTLEFFDGPRHHRSRADEALHAAAAAVRDGRILALKGLGGFQLIVDATNPDAVSRLRQRKRRPDKPLALMISTLDEVRRRCQLAEAEADALCSHQAPILLLRRRTDRHGSGDVVDQVAPGNPYLGVMLPYTPLHHLLIDELRRPIVCTSGNLSEEPMAIATDDAFARLGAIADAWLIHDRPIVRPVDDSVARLTPAGLQVQRRARGFAPLPIELGHDGPAILAVGGHLKNTVGLAVGTQAVLSSHVGDLDNVLSVDVHRQAVDDLLAFFQVAPNVIVCDLHPDYASTQCAERWAGQWQVPLLRVQHHHAHVAACMAEHRLQGPVLGLAWDGTGHGTDGTVWGGEVLQCSGGEFRRIAHLRTFALPGGDRAVRQPRRSALGVLYEILGDDAKSAIESLSPPWYGPGQLDALGQLLKRHVQCPRTSSMGRLFDAVAALCGMPLEISFEGQSAMAIEFAADPDEDRCYPLPLSGQMPAIADWEPLVRAVLADRRQGVPVAQISARFHNSLTQFAIAAARLGGSHQVVLTGGCFQNALLAQRVQGRLAEAGFEVFTHLQVPPGDGGIALGQLALARAMER